MTDEEIFAKLGDTIHEIGVKDIELFQIILSQCNKKCSKCKFKPECNFSTQLKSVICDYYNYLVDLDYREE